MPRIANRTNCRFSHEDPDDPHKSFVLSRFCAGFPLINHIMRSTGYIPELEEFDLTIRECLEGIFGRLSDESYGQVSSPIRHGGFGIRRCAIHASAALVSAMLDSAPMAHHIANPEMLTPIGELLRPMLERDPHYATSPIGPLVDRKLQAVENDPTVPVARKVQHSLGQAIELRRHEDTIARLAAAGHADDVSRLQLASTPNTAGWLLVVPGTANGECHVLGAPPWLTGPEFHVCTAHRRSELAIISLVRYVHYVSHCDLSPPFVK